MLAGPLYILVRAPIPRGRWVLAQTREEMDQTLAERLRWQAARRDGTRVGRCLWRKRVVDGVSQLDEGAARTFYADLNDFICKTSPVVGAASVAAQRIISSAWKRRVGGIVRLRAWAVFRLMTSSNVVGSSTGRSAGLAPLKILSTYAAARRYRSDSFGP